MSAPPKFSTVSWLSQVTAVDNEFYRWPVAYEFSNGRKFTKSDKIWYDTIAAADIAGDESLMMGDDYVRMGGDFIRVEDGEL
jgi:hypothetical protein